MRIRSDNLCNCIAQCLPHSNIQYVLVLLIINLNAPCSGDLQRSWEWEEKRLLSYQSVYSLTQTGVPGVIEWLISSTQESKGRDGSNSCCSQASINEGNFFQDSIPWSQLCHEYVMRAGCKLSRL